MTHEKSCGAVIFTRIGGVPHYVIIQQSKNFFGFPKGHVEKGETEEETALREIFEEVHLKPKLIAGFKAVDEYLLPRKKNTMKQVIFFLAEYSSQKISVKRDELLGAQLLPYESAVKRLRHATLKKILTDANEFIKRLPAPAVPN